jgi:hypothetical protein
MRKCSLKLEVQSSSDYILRPSVYVCTMSVGSVYTNVFRLSVYSVLYLSVLNFYLSDVFLTLNKISINKGNEEDRG